MAPLEVTAPRKHRRSGVALHRSRELTGRDVTISRQIPVTRPARTLLDLATVVDPPAVERALNEALTQRLVGADELTRILRRLARRRGSARLRELVDPAGAPTRSAFEERFLAFCRRQGLARPEVNRIVAGHMVDMLWPAQMLIVALAGRRYHDNPGAFERDRRRDADLVLAGYRVLRITWRRLKDEGEDEARRLRQLLCD
jgi:very-short-patch-repair endonuclease